MNKTASIRFCVDHWGNVQNQTWRKFEISFAEIIYVEKCCTNFPTDFFSKVFYLFGKIPFGTPLASKLF